MDVAEAMKRLAEVKDSLDIDVKQNFIDPLQGLCDKDLKEIQVVRTRNALHLMTSQIHFLQERGRPSRVFNI